MLNAQQFQEKWQRRLTGATEDMRNGINAVTVAPTMQAANKQQKMLANLTARVQDGTWASRLKAVSLDDWKSKMIDKGLGRVAAGAQSAAGKVQDFAAQLIPAITAAQGKISSMPDLTLEDSINRMTTFTREMAKFRKK